MRHPAGAHREPGGHRSTAVEPDFPGNSEKPLLEDQIDQQTVPGYRIGEDRPHDLGRAHHTGNRHPLFYMDNVLITNHIAYASDSAMVKLRRGVTKPIECSIRGEPIPNIVNDFTAKNTYLD